MWKRRRQIKMQFSDLHFKHPHILHTSDELSRSNFFLQFIIPKHPRWNSTSKVHSKCVKCWGVWNANTRIAFLFADALKYITLSCPWCLCYQRFRIRTALVCVNGFNTPCHYGSQFLWQLCSHLGPEKAPIQLSTAYCWLELRGWNFSSSLHWSKPIQISLIIWWGQHHMKHYHFCFTRTAEMGKMFHCN